MEYIAAYSLIAKNTTEELSSEALKSKIVSLLNAIQAPVCTESLDLFISKVSGKSFNELIASGSELMKSQIATSAASATSASTSAAAKVEEVEEVESESEAIDFF